MDSLSRTSSVQTGSTDKEIGSPRDEFANRRISQLEEELAQKTKEVEELTLAAGSASLSIQAFHNQQAQLFDDFVLLRSRYDETKHTLQSVLWSNCAPYHPALKHIPPKLNAKDCAESDGVLDKYKLGEVIGEGQFATVRSCRYETAPAETEDMAIKIITKGRISSFNGLKRISQEISILKSLHSKYVVAWVDAINTENNLYIVTERGGSDLFDFFDQNPEGVLDEWAKEIMSRVLQAVSCCHKVGVCHRDLKPENLLLDFDANEGKVVDLKLCDFGLSAHYKPGKMLNEFCGSPGFFAPEMIIAGEYLGDKADCWSLGCIMLELILGHEQFCELWMGAYDYDKMKDKVLFRDEVCVLLKALPSAMSERFHPECQDFVLQLLQLKGEERPSCEALLSHPWLGQVGVSLKEADDAEEAERRISPLLSRTASVDTPQSSSPGRSSELSCPGTPTTDPNVVRMASLSVETRARSTFHLPPIDPPTPSVSKSRKVLQKVPDETPSAGAESSESPGLIENFGAKPFRKGARRSRDGVDPISPDLEGSMDSRGSRGSRSSRRTPRTPRSEEKTSTPREH